MERSSAGGEPAGLRPRHLAVVTGRTGQPLKRLFRTIAGRASSHLCVEHAREHEGRGFLNARFRYPVRREVQFLTAGVLLEMGSPGGPAPNERLAVRSLMSQTADQIDRSAVNDFADLVAFELTVLAPERALAEKLAFLHHRAVIGDRVRDALDSGQIVELMIDIDARSHAAGWGYTPRPAAGFASSPAFTDDPAIASALRAGYAALADLVWGHLPTYEEAIDTVRSNKHLV